MVVNRSGEIIETNMDLIDQGKKKGFENLSQLSGLGWGEKPAARSTKP